MVYKSINKIIFQQKQLVGNEVLEWISYDQFFYIKEISKVEKASVPSTIPPNTLF
jgi:hypothetical protein